MIKITVSSLLLLTQLTLHAKDNNSYDELGHIILSESGKKHSYKTVAVQKNKVIPENFALAQFPQQASWIWQDLGNSIGQNIMGAYDVDADGEKELILSAGGQGYGDARSVVVLSSDLVTVECSFDLSTTPWDFHVSQMDADATLEVTFVSESGLIAFDGASCEPQIIYEFSGNISSAGLGDVNNDGIPDVAYAQNGHLYLASINDMGNPQERLGFGGTKIIIESLGRSGGDDVGVYNQTHTVLNGDDLSTITEVFDLNGSVLSFADVDGDGSYELVSQGTGNPRTIKAINVSSGNIVSDFEIEWADVIKTQDVNQDGKHEILFGNNQWGDIVVYDYQGSELFRTDNPEHGVSNLHVTDIDGDGNKEMLWGAGHSSSGSDHLFRADWQTETITWQSEDLDGPFMLSKGFVNLNNRKHVAVSVSETNSSYDEGGSFFIDTFNGVRTPLFQPVNTAWGNVNAIDVGPALNGSNPYICHSGDYTYDEFIGCYDAVNGTEKWTREYPNGYINYLKVMDLDNDQSQDILTISTGGIVSAYQAGNGFLKWQSADEISSTIYQGFKDVYLVNGELWILISGDLIKINPNTGATVAVVEDTGLSAIDFVAGQLYGARPDEGFGIINPVDYSMNQLIYPETQTIAYLNVSEDGKVAFVSTGLSQNYPYNQGTPDMDVTLVSIDGDFSPWYVGEIKAYDTNFSNQFELYISNLSSVRKYDLTLLNEDIFANGFE